MSDGAQTAGGCERCAVVQDIARRGAVAHAEQVRRLSEALVIEAARADRAETAVRRAAEFLRALDEHAAAELAHTNAGPPRARHAAQAALDVARGLLWATRTALDAAVTRGGVA